MGGLYYNMGKGCGSLGAGMIAECVGISEYQLKVILPFGKGLIYCSFLLGRLVP